MNQEEYRVELETVVYVCQCAVDGMTPQIARLNQVDPDRLYEVAKKHLLTAAVGMGLESAGIRTEKFEQAIANAQRKNALLDADREEVLEELENAGIWYMPLKGSVLKNMYPRYGMWQMADNDILIDPDRRADVRKIMEKLKFSTKQYGIANHDVYHKNPVSNFEMHAYLINEQTNKQLSTYYLDVKDRLIKDEGDRYGYHFRDEDFYLFLVAHEYKHYNLGGTGLRSLLDIYVYLKQKQDELDWDYIRREATKMGMEAFEEANRQLSTRLFTGAQLSEQENEMLGYVQNSGTYGTLENSVNNQIRKKGRLGYFLSRLTLPYETMKKLFPILNKAPFLYPVMWAWRLISRFFTSNRKMKRELSIAFRKKREQ